MLHFLFIEREKIKGKKNKGKISQGAFFSGQTHPVGCATLRSS
jgi:hypothetical protein